MRMLEAFYQGLLDEEMERYHREARCRHKVLGTPVISHWAFQLRSYASVFLKEDLLFQIKSSDSANYSK